MDLPSPPSPAPIIDALAVDTLAKDFELEPVQRANLQAFVKMGSFDGTLTRSDLLTRTYVLAALYSEAAERRRVAKEQGFADLKGLFNDLKVRLEGRFELTKEQMSAIRKAANDMIYQANRTTFVTMHVDLMKHIRENSNSLGLSNVFSSPSRERVLSSADRKSVV